jgi:hypothetical protein
MREDGEAGLGLVVFLCAVGLVVLVALGWALSYNGWKMDAFFMPREEAVRHETVDCSQAHGDGLARTMREHMVEYQQGDAATKAIEADSLRSDYNGYTCPTYPLPADITTFVRSLQ